MRKMMVVVPFVLVLAMMAGCSKPPQADIDAAKAAVEGARAAEASEYAPDSLKSAEDAQAQLETELKAQEEKFALFRSYKKATELAGTAKGAGEKARTDAAAAKEQAKSEATTLIAEAKAAVEEAKALLEKAPKGKGTQADLEMYKSDLTGAETSVSEADAAITAEKYNEAKAKANAAKSTAGSTKSAIEAAMEAKKMGAKTASKPAKKKK